MFTEANQKLSSGGEGRLTRSILVCNVFLKSIFSPYWQLATYVLPAVLEFKIPVSDRPYIVRSRPDLSRQYGQNLTALCDRHNHMSGTVVHLLARPTHVMCSNPAHQTKAHHVPLGWCGHRGSHPTLGATPTSCFWLVFLVVVARQISSHPTMRIPVANLHLRQLFFCGGSK